jgi:hypothetical protein
MPSIETDLGDLAQPSLVLGLFRLSQSLSDDLVLSIDDPARPLPQVPDLLQSVRTHIPDAKDPNVLVLVQARSDVFDEFLLVFHPLLLGLREGH